MVTTVIAAAGDTWGVSGPAFLGIYAAMLAGAAILWLVTWAVLARRPSQGADQRGLTPAEAAMVNGSPLTAVTAAIAYLRAEGAVEPESRKRGMRVSGNLPPGAGPLEAAVFRAIANGSSRSITVYGNPGVRVVLRDMESHLRGRGFLPTDGQRWLRAASVLWFTPVIGVGLVRVVEGSVNGKPVGFLVPLVIGSVVIALVALALTRRFPRHTPLAKRAIADLRSRVLQPRAQSWSTAGGEAAALSVAVLGVSAFWLSDPDMASAAAVSTQTTTSGWSGSSGDSGSSGGSSCGGGGGGGGCGGGGGGCGG